MLFLPQSVLQGNNYKKLQLFLHKRVSAYVAVATVYNCFTLISRKDCINIIKVAGESYSKPLSYLIIVLSPNVLQTWDCTISSPASDNASHFPLMVEALNQSAQGDIQSKFVFANSVNLD